MPVVKAYALPHPPLALAQIGRGKEKEIPKTLFSFEEIAADIAAAAPETIIYITPHSTIYADYFHISPGSGASGDFLRFGAGNIRLETHYDTQLAEIIEQICGQNGIPAGGLGERDSALDHGTMVPMWFINNHYSSYKSLRISQSGMSASEHYRLGRCIAQAAKVSKRHVAVIGSSDLSHRLSAEGPYGFAPEGPEFDRCVTGALADGDFLSLMKIPEKLREGAGECGYNSLMVIAGVFDRVKVKARLLSYEGPFGVGYAAAEFEGIEENPSYNILERYNSDILNEVEKKKKTEDEYQILARRSLEHIITAGSELPIPEGLSSELVSGKAGVFVSIHKHGKLRGCIGTIAPSTKCIAQEIIQNAISAGLHDSRFPKVTEDELPYLSYKVDVLFKPEKIAGPDELDVKEYGVIVSCGLKRGLLLPNLDGVDTVGKQIEIARQKGGISANEPYTLERFKVIRHEN